jgi:hypothetical protein
MARNFSVMSSIEMLVKYLLHFNIVTILKNENVSAINA